jgi:hypothetical protein
MNKLFLKSVLFSILLFLINNCFSRDIPEMDFSFLDKFLTIDVTYIINSRGKDIDNLISIKEIKYENTKIFLVTGDSEKITSSIYITKNGDPVKTKIYDKIKNIQYDITYGKSIKLTRKENENKTILPVEGNCIDVFMFSFMISGFNAKKDEAFKFNILDYKTGKSQIITLLVKDTSAKFMINEEPVNCIKYKIDSFILFDTELIYGDKNIPVLLYYNGPDSFIFLDRYTINIDPTSYMNIFRSIYD